MVVIQVASDGSFSVCGFLLHGSKSIIGVKQSIAMYGLGVMQIVAVCALG